MNKKLDGTGVGQNAAWESSSAKVDEAAIQGDEAVQRWYDEVTDPGFDSQSIKSFV